MSEIEDLSCNEVICSLWNRNSPEKCRLGLVDAIIYENGLPAGWYITGKTGEIIKKRTIDFVAISQRWRRISSQSNSSIIAILRQYDGILKFLNEEAWETFLQGASIPDFSILSCHCYVKGTQSSFLRNKYEMKDMLNRFVTSTYSYSFAFDESQDVIVITERDCRNTEIKASSLRNVVDLATHTVIRHIEALLSIKIITISIDYVVDTKSQLWMLWSSKCQYVRTTNLTEINLPGLPSGDRTGRMGWAGSQYFNNGGLDKVGSPASFSRKLSSASLSRKSLARLSPERSKSIRSESPQKVDISAVREQIQSAASIIDNIPFENKAKTTRKRTPTSMHTVQEALEGDHLKQDSFPDPFKCRGDFCNIRVKTAGSLEISSENQLHVMEKLFTSDQLMKLRKNKQFPQMFEFGMDGPALATVSSRSISLAREERNMKESSVRDKGDWRSYPLTPRQRSNPNTISSGQTASGSRSHGHYSERGGDSKSVADDSIFSADGDASSVHSFHSDLTIAPHAEDDILSRDKKQREKFTKHMARYYDQVRVCGVCYRFYTALDWAREELGFGDAYGAGREGMGAAASSTAGTGTVSSPSLGLRRASTRSPVKANRHSSSMNSFPLVKGSKLEEDTITSAAAPEIRKTNSSDSEDEKKGEVITTNDDTNNTEQQQQQQGNLNSKKPPRKTWKDYVSERTAVAGGGGGGTKGLTNNNTASVIDPSRFSDLDGYLRQGPSASVEKKAAKRTERAKVRLQSLKDRLQETEASVDSNPTANLYCAKVLLACALEEHTAAAKAILEEAYFTVKTVVDGRDAINAFLSAEGGFDCVLVERNVPLANAFEVTKVVREFDRKLRKRAAAEAAAAGSGVQPPSKRVPVICFTSATNPADLKLYMQADMDGCVTYPVSQASLLNTVRAAAPQHLAVVSLPQPEPEPEPVQIRSNAKVYRMGPLGALDGSLDSASLASKQMSFSASMDEDAALLGVLQVDPDTRVSYVVLDASPPSSRNLDVPFFNLVVCHDMFDTYERLKIFFKPIVQKYVGLQILLWNYAGQAFTEWRDEQLLTSEFHTHCLNELLGQVGMGGSKEFNTSKPFYILGYGFGATIATFYLTHYRIPNARGLLSVNGWSYCDSNLAAALHDCINVFQCTPSARPDLPVYFFSRFLFSKDYLAKVSVPLALNLYTAVHNPISIKGRISLCKGALASLDLRQLLSGIDIPVICIHGTQNAFARSLHTEPFVNNRGGEVRSIFKALEDPDRTCVIWMKSGHEIFQECRKQTLTLLEQILTGFHDKNDMSFASAAVVDGKGLQQGMTVNNFPNEESLISRVQTANSLEDKFIDNILGSMSKVSTTAKSKRNVPKAAVMSSYSPGSSISSLDGTLLFPEDNNNGGRAPNDFRSSAVDASNNFVFANNDDSSTWSKYSKSLMSKTVPNNTQSVTSTADTTATSKRKTKKNNNVNDKPKIILDPTTTAFERQDNSVYGTSVTSVASASAVSNPVDFPEVKEYMTWRLKRNKKRLQRLQAAANVIQSAYRVYRAKVKVNILRRKRAVVTIQRYYRGWVGRCRFLEQARRIWASQLLQRIWRGYAGRLHVFRLRLAMAAAVTLQRVWRGVLSRSFVNNLKRRRNEAACLLQSIFRRNRAKRLAWQRRVERHAAIEIQRVFRGCMGRKKAATERDKYIFSRSQTQGIEFGRQMLLEHKLHATRLQSDVTLLSQEKISAEEQVESLLEEISSFEEGVRVLSKEMHQLSKVETEAAAYLDDQSRGELREQKMRLDREFGEMLIKIGSRKELLNGLELKLSAVDKARQGKEEELRTLERKLVVLLEEQQNELNAIKRKQDVRGALLAASHDQLMRASTIAPGATGGSDSMALVPSGGGGGANLVGGGGGRGGPSIQEKRQAAQLMQSTETLMKFGFMSMSMTYFSSLNMIKALRTVSAQDTVMAALSDVHAQRAANFGLEGSGGGGVGKSMGADMLGGAMSEGKGQFLPALKPGQLPGQEALRVSAWSVEDVGRWLQTLSLTQYCEAFQDAAVDGEFLYDLNDDDLKNTLGVEHRLHRKKILNCIYRLKLAEAQRDSRVEALLQGQGQGMASPEVCSISDLPSCSSSVGVRKSLPFPSLPFPSLLSQSMAPEIPISLASYAHSEDVPLSELAPATKSNRLDPRLIEGPKIPFEELLSLVRHAKYSLVKEALDYLPNKNFDRGLVQKVGYIPDLGTAYVDGYDRLLFHVNKTDENGNTLLIHASQNGNDRIVKFLISKGANPNHQNKFGHTAAHFAIAYQFFELSQWLFENGADDSITNKFGHTPYDGIQE